MKNESREEQLNNDNTGLLIAPTTLNNEHSFQPKSSSKIVVSDNENIVQYDDGEPKETQNEGTSQSDTTEWPSLNATTVNEVVKNNENSLTCDIKNDIVRNGLINFNKSITLDEALDSFHLAYNPRTKQLEHVGEMLDINKSNEEAVENTCATKGHKRDDTISSFSSAVSSLSDPSSTTSLEAEEPQVSSDENTNKDRTNKRKGFTGFFSRKVFSSTGSWRLFGMGRALSTESLSSTHDLVASSSALIQHIRPATLPVKDSEEERKHREEYEEILQAARKREMENSKARKKKQERQLRQEEQLSAAAKQWALQILPQWESMRNQRKTRDLWWQGLPPSVRGRVWMLAIGNELNITSNLYEICVARAQKQLQNASSLCEKTHVHVDSDSSNVNDQASSLNVIQLDISRTFPNLGIFQESGPYFQILHELLAAYVCYRPDVGYVQGMSFLAAILILNMEPVNAFICFANLVNRPLMLAAFTVNQTLMNVYYQTYNELFLYNLPQLHQHFLNASLTPDLYLLDWIYTVFAKAMPLDLACRVWDLFLRDGDEFIFRTALGVLNLYNETLLKMDFLDGAQFLIRLPDDLSSDQLFKCIKSISVNVNKQNFTQLVDKYRDIATNASTR